MARRPRSSLGVLAEDSADEGHRWDVFIQGEPRGEIGRLIGISSCLMKILV